MATYGSLDGFRAYMCPSAWRQLPHAASDALALAALIRGSDIVRVRYLANLCGYDIASVPTGSDLPIVEKAAYIAACLNSHA